jgi:DNA-binding transcriptional ArsR family regulator
MENQSDDQVEFQRRLASLEREVTELKSRLGMQKLDESNAWVGRIEKVKEMDAPTARDHLQAVLPALQALARERNERLHFVAFADSQTASGGGPDASRAFARDELVQPLASLAAAVGHPTRAKLLQMLLLREECTVTELSEVSGATGGNLYQHLNELHGANLIHQPGRGRYRLTANGQFTVEMLFWCAVQVRRTLPPEFGQSGWFDTEVPKTKSD